MKTIKSNIMTHATDHNKHPLTSCYALCLAVLLFSIIAPHTAHAVLMTETQIIINSQDRTAELTIKNTSKQTSIYRFVWDHIGFNADGEFKRIEDGNFPDGLTSVDDYIRLRPCRVIAEPGHIQNIRFLARRTKDMPAGEYRSYFSLLPEELPKNMTRKMTAKPSVSASAQWWAGKYRLSYGTVKPP